LGSICGHLPPATFRPFSKTGPKQAACSVTSTPESSASIAAYTSPAPPNRVNLFPSQLFQPTDSCTYAQAALLWSYTEIGGVPALPYCPKMGLASFRTSGPGSRKVFAVNRPGVRPASGGLASFRILIALAPRTSRLASFRTSPHHVRPITHTLAADWLRFAFSECRRPAHLPIGFVPHQSPPCAPNRAPARTDTSMFPTRTQAFKLYCGYRGMA
jgi:hypothetical protein